MNESANTSKSDRLCFEKVFLLKCCQFKTCRRNESAFISWTKRELCYNLYVYNSQLHISSEHNFFFFFFSCVCICIWWLYMHNAALVAVVTSFFLCDLLFWLFVLLPEKRIECVYTGFWNHFKQQRYFNYRAVGFLCCCDILFYAIFSKLIVSMRKRYKDFDEKYSLVAGSAFGLSCLDFVKLNRRKKKKHKHKL